MFTVIIGYTAALVTTLCLVPQLYKIITQKNIEGVSVWTYIILFSGQILWVVYGLLVSDNIVICANLVSGLISFLIILFFYFYKNKSNSNSDTPLPFIRPTLRRPENLRTH